MSQVILRSSDFMVGQRPCGVSMRLAKGEQTHGMWKSRVLTVPASSARMRILSQQRAGLGSHFYLKVNPWA